MTDNSNECQELKKLLQLCTLLDSLYIAFPTTPNFAEVASIETWIKLYLSGVKKEDFDGVDFVATEKFLLSLGDDGDSFRKGVLSLKEQCVTVIAAKLFLESAEEVYEDENR